MIPSRDGLHPGRLLGGLVLAGLALRTGFGSGQQTPLGLVDLAFHEAGHLFLLPFGRTAHFLGGTLGQIAVPVVLAVSFLRREQPLGAAFCLWWLGENFVNVSIYMADARTLALPLLGGGEHDWNELFFRFGLLDGPSVARVSGATRFCGVVAMTLGVAWWALLVPRGETALRLREALVPHHVVFETLLPPPEDC